MIQKKKFVKTFRNTKTVQLILLLLLETAYVLVLTLNPALGTKLFEDRTLFILCTLSWILALFNLIWLLYDFYKLGTFADESHALNRAAFLDHLTGIPNRHGLDVVFETYDSPESLAHVACYMVTITNLKEINQTMGHVVGDQMLKDFSGILESVGDAFGVVGRNGGNEFLMIVNHGSHDTMEYFIESLNQQLKEYNEEHSNAPIQIQYAYILNEHMQSISPLCLQRHTISSTLKEPVNQAVRRTHERHEHSLHCRSCDPCPAQRLGCLRGIVCSYL